jgi:hypothetical protein
MRVEVPLEAAIIQYHVMEDRSHILTMDTFGFSSFSFSLSLSLSLYLFLCSFSFSPLLNSHLYIQQRPEKAMGCFWTSCERFWNKTYMGRVEWFVFFSHHKKFL